MDPLSDVRALPLGRKLALGAAVVLFIDLFLSWQQVCINASGINVCGSSSGWRGIGLLVGLLALAVIAWEVARLVGRTPEVPIDAELITAGLAGGAALFAVLEFLTHNESRHWPAWIGLLAAIALAAGAAQLFTATHGHSHGGEPLEPVEPAV